jgi:hypothetical protein
MTTTTYTAVSLNKIDKLDSSTLGIIELAKALLTDKECLPKAEFSKMIQLFGWGKGVLNGYLKIAQAFRDVEIAKLIRIEPRTLFKITSTKKFASVVEGIKKTIGHVTQQLVENLIDACRTPRVAKSDEPTIWRAEKDGSRSCVVPPIKEDDQFTGLSIQRAMDTEGISTQSFVREAAAFREAWLSGLLLLVGELPPHLEAILGDKFDYPAPTPDDSEETVEFVEARGTMEVVEVVEVVEEIETPQDIETSVAIASDLPLSFEKIAAPVVQCQTPSEVAAITSLVDEPTRHKSWDILCESEQQPIIAMKEAFVREQRDLVRSGKKLRCPWQPSSMVSLKISFSTF